VGELHFFLGGARSGKSRLARDRARALGGDSVTFVATARPGDPELDLRIAAHRRDRPSGWRTIEPATDLASALREIDRDHVVLLDSLTLWASALLERGVALAGAWDTVENAIGERERPTVLVSDEVGLGIVPMSEVGRTFRDELGWIHQRIAKRAASASLVVAGLAIALKAPA